VAPPQRVNPTAPAPRSQRANNLRIQTTTLCSQCTNDPDVS
jgi:hypothetical protein